MLLLGVLVFLTSCSKSGMDSDEMTNKDSIYYYESIQLAKDQMLKSNSINNFGFKLYEELNASGNAMISPLSISMAMSMLAAGTASKDQGDLLNILCFNGNSADEVCSYFKDITASLLQVGKSTSIKIANSIWGNSNSNLVLNEDYIEKCRNYFSAIIKSIDFSEPESLTEVNKWISDNTGGKIENALPNLSGTCILANAFYFKSMWGVDFKKTGDRQMKVSLRTSYYDSESFDMVEVPYSDSNYAIDILRPKGGITPQALIGRLNNGKWNDVINSFIIAETLITMPIFSFRYDTFVNNPIKELGFDVSNADFSEIGEPSPSFDSILHKTYIDVNEKGTETSAVTVINLTSSSGKDDDTPEPQHKTVDFNVDEPFLFILRERETGVIVALGQYTSF